MKTFKICSGLILSIGLVAQISLGQARQAGQTDAGATEKPPTPVTTPTPVATNINQSLNKTSSEQSSTAMIAAVAAGVFGTKAVICCATVVGGNPCGAQCPLYVAAAAGSVIVALENSSKSAGNSDAACKFLAGGCSGSGGSTKPDGNGANGSGSGATDSSMKVTNDALATARKNLAAVGAKVDFANKTVTMPNGAVSKIDPGAASAALSAAGLTSSDLKAMANKALAEKGGTPKAAEGVESDGVIGVGGGKAGNTGEVSGSTGALPVLADPQLGINRDPAQVAGLSTNLNGTPIGVASDSLFGIIDRRYQLHSDRGSFIPPLK